MTEPTTITQAYVVPATGDLVGAWGTSAVNPNMVAIDGTFGGFTTISLGAATTLALSNPGAPSPGAGPNQSQNACIYLTGTLTGNNVIQLTTPKEYIFHNQCGSASAFFIQVQPAAGTGAGTAVGLPPGRKCRVFYDGTNVDFSSPADPGTAYDLHGATAYPVWMNACTIRPYLIKDGSTYSTSAYTALAAVLGATFGGNGVTTFGVPDERARARIGFDPNGTGRITNPVSGMSGTQMGSAGGDQQLQDHTHTATFTGNQANYTVFGGGGITVDVISAAGGGFGVIQQSIGGAQPLSGSPFAQGTPTGAIAVSSQGGGNAQNMPPSIVSFLPLIKT